MEDIRLILLHDWAPTGVEDVPEAQDEYDSYVGEVYRLLANGSSPLTVAGHLARIEHDTMGLPAIRHVEDLLPVARKLTDLDVRLESQ